MEEHAREEVLLYKMPQLMKAWKEWRTYSRLRQLVSEATAQQKDPDALKTSKNDGIDETLKNKVEPEQE
jgi:phage terminase large subunit GpA-like protein